MTPTLDIRRGTDRGHFDHGWLDTYHTFSFADYHDPAHMGFSVLRVINDDRVAAGMGFGMHPHKDMEIVTVVLEGALEHKDSMGNKAAIRPGEVQRMSAGTGILHSEYNPSATEAVHLLQIWLLPAKKGIEPSYEQTAFDPAQRQGAWQLVASPDGADGSVTLNQDARLFLADLAEGQALQLTVPPGRQGFLHVARGAVTADGTALNAGDALRLTSAGQVALAGAGAKAELLFFDLP